MFRRRRVPSGAGEDPGLVGAAQRGSADAIESLVRLYWHGAYRVALGIVSDSAAAEDIAQESLLVAIRGLHKFDARRPFRPWLHRIVANRSIDWLRASSRRAETSLDERTLEARGTVEGEALSGEVAVALHALDPYARAIVVLRHVGGFTSKEIGAMLGMSATNVRSMLQRSLARLRTELERGNGSEPVSPRQERVL